MFNRHGQSIWFLTINYEEEILKCSTDMDHMVPNYNQNAEILECSTDIATELMFPNYMRIQSF